MRSNSGVIRKTADTGLDGELVVCVCGVGGAWIEAVDFDGGNGWGWLLRLPQNGCCLRAWRALGSLRQLDNMPVAENWLTATR